MDNESDDPRQFASNGVCREMYLVTLDRGRNRIYLHIDTLLPILNAANALYTYGSDAQLALRGDYCPFAVCHGLASGMAKAATCPRDENVIESSIHCLVQ